MIIGITGLIGSGKGAVAEYLTRNGYVLLGHSAIIADEVRKRGMDVTRDTLTQVGNEVRAREGLDAWAKRLIARMEPGKGYIVEGFRSVGEIHAFRAKADFVLLGVAAGKTRRMPWVFARGKSGDPRTPEEFARLEQRDFLQADPAGQQNALCFALADYYMTNEGTLEELYVQVEKVLGKLQVN